MWTYGHDFGLVEIPEALVDQVRFDLPYWGGPDGVGVLAEGDPVVYYGHAATYGVMPQTRPRIGLGLGEDRLEGSSSWMVAGPIMGGDSGGPVLMGVPDADGRLSGGPAIGIATHGVLHTGPFFGTTIRTAQEDVRCHAGISIRIEPGGEFLEGCPDHVDLGCPAPGHAQGTSDTFYLRVRPFLCLTQDPDAEGHQMVLADKAAPLADTLSEWTYTFREGANITAAHATLWIRLTEDTLFRDLGVYGSIEWSVYRNEESIGRLSWSSTDEGLPSWLPAGDHKVEFPVTDLDATFEPGDVLRLSLLAWTSSSTARPTMYLLYGNAETSSRFQFEGVVETVGF